MDTHTKTRPAGLFEFGTEWTRVLFGLRVGRELETAAHWHQACGPGLPSGSLAGWGVLVSLPTFKKDGGGGVAPRRRPSPWRPAESARLRLAVASAGTEGRTVAAAQWPEAKWPSRRPLVPAFNQ